MINPKDTKSKTLTAIELILIIGLIVLDYFTRKRMGAMRTVLFYNSMLEFKYNLQIVFALITIFFILASFYTCYKNHKISILTLVIPLIMIIILIGNFKRLKLMKYITLVVLTIIQILQIIKERDMKYSNKALALLLVGGFTLVGCNNANQPAENAPVTETTEPAETAETTETTETTETAAANYNEITGEELDKIEEDDKEKENYLVIDVRDADKYAEGHIKHALSIPESELADRLSEIEGFKGSDVVVYANTAANSAAAAQTLADNGFTKVHNAAGLDEFTYTTNTKARTALPEEFKELAASGDYTIVDVRDPEDYNKGTMPGAINVPVDQAEELVPTLPTDKPFLTYCYSGNRSWKVANMLAEEGHEVINAWDGTKEYDGYDLSEAN